MKSKSRIGLFGGTFNPIHLGHLAVAQQVLEEFGLDRMVFVPAYLPVLKSARGLAQAKHRLKMVRLAIQGNPRFSVSSLEIKRKGKSYTIDTIWDFLKRSGNEGAELFFIIGADSIPEFYKWKQSEELLNLCRFIVVPRPGYALQAMKLKAKTYMSNEAMKRFTFIQLKTLNISSTEIRRAVKKGKDISYLVPKAVDRYIKGVGIYH